MHPEKYLKSGSPFPIRSYALPRPKRLTHPRFLRMYQQLLRKDGIIHLKTDSPDLYRFTRLVIGMYGLTLHRSSENAYGMVPVPPELTIKTHYEKLDIAGSNTVFTSLSACPPKCRKMTMS